MRLATGSRKRKADQVRFLMISVFWWYYRYCLLQLVQINAAESQGATSAAQTSEIKLAPIWIVPFYSSTSADSSPMVLDSNRRASLQSS